MSMHRGVKPAGQPNTLRSIIEGKLSSSDCPSDLPYDYKAGAPSGAPGMGGTYNDSAEGASGRGAVPRPAAVVPFTSNYPAREGNT